MINPNKYNEDASMTQSVNSVFLSLSGFLTDNILTVITSGHIQDLRISCKYPTLKILCARASTVQYVNLNVGREGGGDSPLCQKVRCHCCDRPL